MESIDGLGEAQEVSLINTSNNLLSLYINLPTFARDHICFRIFSLGASSHAIKITSWMVLVYAISVLTCLLSACVWKHSYR